MPAPDEFDWIAGLRPLTRGVPGAFGLLDDAALLPSRPGWDLVVTKDAMVEGVHVLPGEDRAIIARRLLRTNLSDLAAKGAEPAGYLLMISWPRGHGREDEAAFIRGLAEDGETFGLPLLGGDTVFADGPLTVSATLFGWVPQGRMVRRGGASPGDVLMVTGGIGDGLLGLRAARGEIPDPDGVLSTRYRLPQPRLELRQALLDHASAAADVSDGLFADALHVAEASGCEALIAVDDIPVSAGGRDWIAGQASDLAARLALAAGGDDYELVCAVPASRAAAFAAACAAAGTPAAVIGRFQEGSGLRLTWQGLDCVASDFGYRHR